MITKNITNFIYVLQNNYCGYGDDRNYFNSLKKYLEISPFKINNNLVVHSTQPINQQTRESINLFVKANFINILRDIVDNQLVKSLLEQVTYDQLLELFIDNSIFEGGRQYFIKIDNFVMFIYFLGNNGRTFSNTYQVSS